MLKNVATLTVANVLIFVLHYLLGQAATSYALAPMYGLCFVLALGIYLLLEQLYKAIPNYVGYIYLVLGIVKMIVLWLYFNQITNGGNDLPKADLLGLFVSFFLNLILEIVVLSKLLNLSDLSK